MVMDLLNTFVYLGTVSTLFSFGLKVTSKRPVDLSKKEGLCFEITVGGALSLSEDNNPPSPKEKVYGEVLHFFTLINERYYVYEVMEVGIWAYLIDQKKIRVLPSRPALQERKDMLSKIHTDYENLPKETREFDQLPKIEENKGYYRSNHY
jgi:hypothetical protein